MFRRFSRLDEMRGFMLVLVFFTGLLLAAEMRAQSPSQEIRVSAAISLKNAFEEIGKTFMQKHPDDRIRSVLHVFIRTG